MIIATPPPSPTLEMSLFLDIDGTLIEFTNTPSTTFADEEIKNLLTRATQQLRGAVALVSGREIKTMDALFAPLVLPASGLHGGERRDANGVMHRSDVIEPRLDEVRRRLNTLATQFPGIIIEDKGQNLAVHFRLVPQYAEQVQEAFARIAAPLADRYQLQPGLMMMELKPRGPSKGIAVSDFMHEAPFAGRLPVFVGDDLTDVYAFDAVDALGGWSVGVGARVQGRYRLDNVTAVRAWLKQLAAL
jgi:trehalose 6-phosphate phosphatase